MNPGAVQIAIVAPSPVPVASGGAETLWAGLLAALNAKNGVKAELITLPTPERSVPDLLASYRQFDRLDLSRFDWVISGKYPAWMVRHPRHVVYMLHTLRGLYDLYAPQPPEPPPPQIWRDLGLPLAVEAALRHPGTTRLEAIEIIDAVIPAAARLPPNHPALNFPGVFARALIHTLDALGLAPDRIHRYAAISDAVRRRPDYFPTGVAVDPIHIPTSLTGLRRGARAGSGRALFTVSRLDPAKRIDVIIQAYRLSGLDLPLRIAGAGPEDAALKRLADGDPRIQFLGRVDDAALAAEYGEALFVPFIPYQEDFGLVTIEAMAAGKPVLTATDSGGVLELVRHGANGWIADPTAEALAEGMRALASDPDRLARMGDQAQRDVAPVTWETLTRRLLPEVFDAAPAVIGRARPLVVGINTFAITPIANGGQVRLANLYGELAKQAEVRFVNLAGGLHRREERALAPGLTEICLPVAAPLAQRSGALGRRLGGAGALDLAAALYPQLAPEWLDALREAALPADLIVCAHPYGCPAWTTVGLNRPMIYESFNVEYDLKTAIYGRDRRWALEAVRRIESDCLAAADAVAVCSTLDGERMRDLYGLGDRPIHVLPNGVSLADSVFVSPAERARAAAAIGKRRPLALFMASAHGPNVDALPEVVAAARACPEVDFAVMGAAGAHLTERDLPPNLKALGVVTAAEKARWLALADFGLNPIVSGSGTNLKLAEHAASGNLIVSTPFGARGGAFEAGRHYVAQDADLAAAIHVALGLSEAERAAMIEAARETMLRTANWEAAGRDYADLVTSLLKAAS